MLALHDFPNPQLLDFAFSTPNVISEKLYSRIRMECPFAAPSLACDAPVFEISDFVSAELHLPFDLVGDDPDKFTNCIAFAARLTRFLARKRYPGATGLPPAATYNREAQSFTCRIFNCGGLKYV